VTAAFVDTEDRVVPQTDSIKMSADLGSFESPKTQQTAFNDEGDAVATYNYTADGEAGQANITAIGGGVAGSATITVTEVTEPGQVQLTNVTLDPSTVTANTSNDHTLTFDAENVSDDGNTDTFTVTIPQAATLESANSVNVTDVDGQTVALSGGPDVSGNTITFSVSPDSAADTRDLTVEADITVSAPNVTQETMADITIDVADSDNGQDSTTAMLTVQPEGAEVFPEPIPGTGANNPPQDTDDDGLYEDVNGDGDANFDDAVALAFADTDALNSQQVAALDFDGDGDGDVDFDDAIELAFSV
jgi:PKD repeat protein